MAHDLMSSGQTEASPASTSAPISRRGFLGTGAGLAASLVVAVHIPGLLRTAEAAAEQPFVPNDYVRIGSDGTVTIVMALNEMGQGIHTAVPMLIAEELDVDLAQVVVENAPADEKRYGHPLYGLQVTGGSASVQAAWAALRKTGATARAMLLSAASMSWGVPVSECDTTPLKGEVTHKPTGRSLKYGALVERAAALPVPKDVALKDTVRFTLVGTRAHRLDTPGKVDGSAKFGIDVMLPGMKVAAIANAPVIGGKLKSVNDSRALAVAGVQQVLRTDNAVAVVADHYGAAKKGLGLLELTWDDGAGASFSNQVWSEQLTAALTTAGLVTTNDGDLDGAFAAAARRHKVVYESPPLAHTTMEPVNVTLHVQQDRCDLWLGTQAAARAQGLAAGVLEMPAERVAVHNHLIGGGFGRKLDADYVATAAKLARQVPYPLKVIFSREEDIQHDAYRPHFRHELSAALDERGMPTGFLHRFAGSSVIARYAPTWLANGKDGDAVDVAESPYEISAKRVEFIRHEPPAGLLTGNWRGVGPTNNAFVHECFIDELAALAKRDPVLYRKQLLARNPRGLAAISLAAEKAGWGGALPEGSGRGIAFVDGWKSRAALVMEVSVARDGAVRVNRMVCAIDCGLAVNPDGVEAQMQGGLLYGLTAALFGTITFEGGRVVQSNFHDYQPLHMDQAPAVEVYVVRSTEPPGGVGEIGTAVAIPAFLNAVHAATGKRFRTYPIPANQLHSV